MFHFEVDLIDVELCYKNYYLSRVAFIIMDSFQIVRKILIRNSIIFFLETFKKLLAIHFTIFAILDPKFIALKDRIIQSF